MTKETQIELLEKGFKSLEAVKEANTALAKKYDGLDIDKLNKSAEAATAAMEGLQEIKIAQKANEDALKNITDNLLKPGNGKNAEDLGVKYGQELSAYLKKGRKVTDDTFNAICTEIVTKSTHGLNSDEIAREVKALQVGVETDGGYLVSPSKSATIIKRIIETSPMRLIAGVENTTSDSLEFPIDDDVAGDGGWTGETSTRSETSTPAVGKLIIPAHEVYAEPRATQKLLDDAGFDIESWLMRKVAEKIGRTENTAFVSGDGHAKPRGFTTLAAWASAGVYERNKLEQVKSGVSGVITADTLKGLKNSLLEPYQTGAKFTMKRDTFTEVIKLHNGMGDYLLNPDSFRNGDDKVLLGREVVFFSDMAAVGADALAIAYGDFGVGYTIVDRIGIRIIRDMYTAKPYVKFYTTKRVGGDVTNFEAIKLYKLAV